MSWLLIAASGELIRLFEEWGHEIAIEHHEVTEYGLAAVGFCGAIAFIKWLSE